MTGSGLRDTSSRNVGPSTYSETMNSVFANLLERVHPSRSWMRQRRSRPGLTSQSLPAFRVLCKSTGQYFDGDLSTQSCIVGQIYDPHTAGADAVSSRDTGRGFVRRATPPRRAHHAWRARPGGRASGSPARDRRRSETTSSRKDRSSPQASSRNVSRRAGSRSSAW